MSIPEPPPDFPSTWREQIALFATSRRWLRVVGYTAVAFVLTPVLLGFIFMMAFFPLTLVFMRLAMIYTPAYRLVGRILGVEPLPSRLARPPTLFILTSVVYILFGIAVAVVCIRLLFYSGFCDQNLVCLASTKFWFTHSVLQ